MVGDLLYGTVFNYFALNDLQDKIAAQTSGIVTYRLPSYGIFTTSLKTQYWYGIPRNVEFGGLSMDIDHMKLHHVSKTNNADERKAFSQSIGLRMSAMEHLVPEQMFSTDTQKAQGISAVKAIALASQQGQKNWTIDQSNLELALSKIDLGADTEIDIRNAVYAGKIVTTHTSKINFNGWIGEGYIITDPQTGAGAYMIAGGGNGTDLSLLQIYALIFGLLAVAAATILLAVVAVAALIFIALWVAVYAVQVALFLTVVLLIYGIYDALDDAGNIIKQCDALTAAMLLMALMIFEIVSGAVKLKLLPNAMLTGLTEWMEPDRWCGA